MPSVLKNLLDTSPHQLSQFFQQSVYPKQKKNPDKGNKAHLHVARHGKMWANRDKNEEHLTGQEETDAVTINTVKSGGADTKLEASRCLTIPSPESINLEGTRYAIGRWSKI